MHLLTTVTLVLGATMAAGCAHAPNSRPPDFPDAQIATSCQQNSRSPTGLRPDEQARTEALVAAAVPTRTARYFVEEAYARAIDGNREEAIRLFELAVRFPDNDRPIDRVQWSYGWGLFALGDYACALARFEAARQASPDTTTWLPQTLAVVYWRLGERQLAVDWYAVAVRELASCWADPRTVVRCTRHWRPHEQRALLEVTAAWRAKRFQSQAR